MDREQALDTALGQIERAFGKGAVMKMNDAAAVSVGAVSSGSLSLDLALGIGGGATDQSGSLRLLSGAPAGQVLLLAVVFGLGAAFGLTRLIASKLYGVTPMDPLTITIVVLLLTAVATLALVHAGSTPVKGEYRSQVKRGVDFIVASVENSPSI